MKRVQSNIVPLIICGGAGTRLWPASREGRPKQFLPLLGKHSSFQQTLRRVGDPQIFARPVVVASHEHRFLIAEQCQEIGMEADILLEPIRRDSAPAIAAGAYFIRRRDPEAVVLVLAADHVIPETEVFVSACRAALQAARDGHLVTFGVTPSRPASDYGYIRPGARLNGGAVHAVAAFVEKPDAATAERYVADGYLWNSGNFMFRADVFFDELTANEPETARAVATAVDEAREDLGFCVLAQAAFARAKPISIDYAVMEKTARAAVAPAPFAWADIGSWNAVWELAGKDAAGNAAKGEAVFAGARNCYVASDKAVVAMVGVEDLAVVASEDAILVARRNDPSGVKAVVQQLKITAPALTENHVRTYRPWGFYHSLDLGARYQVKRIVVKPGGKLSLQKHFHRAEHWVVVRGTATVTLENEERTLHENQSIDIPIGAVHRLENPGKIDLELIEVQTGSYLGEDDIVRTEDIYQRR
jgi:mannose-1-phosphate guanylyltransferase/mannose-6-phosphate isomerase